MPNTKSAKKRLRQSLERRTKNRAVKSALRTQMRKVREAAQAGELERAQSELRVAFKKLDQAAAKGVIHPNSAARRKSRLNATVKSAAQPSQSS